MRHSGHSTTRAEWQDAWERAQQRADDLQAEARRLRIALQVAWEWLGAEADPFLDPDGRKDMAMIEAALDRVPAAVPVDEQAERVRASADDDPDGMVCT